MNTQPLIEVVREERITAHAAARLRRLFATQLPPVVKVFALERVRGWIER